MQTVAETPTFTRQADKLFRKIPIYLLLAYGKGAKIDMTSDEKRAVSALVTALKATRKEMT